MRDYPFPTYPHPKTMAGCASRTGGSDIQGTYRNLHKWPEGEAEFLQWVAGGRTGSTPQVVDCYSCRQIFLRSYRFCLEDDIGEEEEKKNMRKKKMSSANVVGKGKGDDQEPVSGKEKKKRKTWRSRLLSLLARTMSCNNNIA